MDESFTLLLVKMNDNFRIRRRFKYVPLLNESIPNLNVIINLAVKSNPDCAIFVGQRLLPTLDIDNTQSAMRQRDVFIEIGALPVGTSMRKSSRHPLE